MESYPDDPDDSDGRRGVPFQTEDGLDRVSTGSLMFHRIERELRGDTPFREESAFMAASRAAPDIADMNQDMWRPFSGDANTPKVTQAAGWSTVVEAAALCEAPVDADTLTRALDYLLEKIRELQQMYYLVTRVPVTLVTRERLPMSVPVVVREVMVRERGRETVLYGSLIDFFLFRVNDGSTSVLCFAPQEKFAKKQLKQMTSSERLWPGPFAVYANFRREAAIAERSGNWLVASALNGAAAEAFLRDLHVTLMWDEGLEPAQAAQEMRLMISITSLVKKAFHHRIGGVWDLAKEGPLRDWRCHTAGLRDRVLHMGYNVDVEDVEKSFDAMENLDTYVVSLLKRKVGRYPCAIMFLLRYGGVRHPDKFYYKAWDLATASFYGPNPAETFGAWRREVERLLEDDVGTVGDVTRGTLMCVNYINGEVHYWLVDNQVGLACRAKTPDCALSLFTEFPRLGDTGLQQSITLAGVRPMAADDPPQWVPSIEVIPSIPYRRFQSCFIPPSVHGKSDQVALRRNGGVGA